MIGSTKLALFFAAFWGVAFVQSDALAMSSEASRFTGPMQPHVQVQLGQDVPDVTVIVESVDGNLTVDVVNAYIEALEFCLAQLGPARRFSDDERYMIMTELADGWYRYYENQDRRLYSNMRPIWTSVQQNWSQASSDEQRAFVDFVLWPIFRNRDTVRAMGTLPSTVEALGLGWVYSVF